MTDEVSSHPAPRRGDSRIARKNFPRTRKNLAPPAGTAKSRGFTSVCGTRGLIASRRLAGRRKTLRAYADPRVFRPLREKRPAFICHRQRQAAFPQTMLRMVWSHEAANPHSATPTKKDGPPFGGPSFWSEWRDLNSRPHGPEPCALPSALHPETALSL